MRNVPPGIQTVFRREFADCSTAARTLSATVLPVCNDLRLSLSAGTLSKLYSTWFESLRPLGPGTLPLRKEHDPRLYPLPAVARSRAHGGRRAVTSGGASGTELGIAHGEQSVGGAVCANRPAIQSTASTVLAFAARPWPIF